MSGCAPAAAAALGVRVVMDTDVGALEGVAELGVIQLADGARKVLRRVKFHDANHAAAVAEDIHVVGRAHLPEVVLPTSQGPIITASLEHEKVWICNKI
jgi:hypothetical protein